MDLKVMCCSCGAQRGHPDNPDDMAFTGKLTRVLGELTAHPLVLQESVGLCCELVAWHPEGCLGFWESSKLENGLWTQNSTCRANGTEFRPMSLKAQQPETPPLILARN